MSQVEIGDAAGDLAAWVDRASAGEEVVLARHGRIVARIVAVPSEPAQADLPPRRLGALQGKYKVPDDFDRPLPDDLLDLFEGKS